MILSTASWFRNLHVLCKPGIASAQILENIVALGGGSSGKNLVAGATGVGYDTTMNDGGMGMEMFMGGGDAFGSTAGGLDGQGPGQGQGQEGGVGEPSLAALDVWKYW